MHRLLFLVTSCALAQPPLSELLERQTMERLEQFQKTFDGVLGVAVIDLETGRKFALNGDVVFAQASVIKVPILAALHHAERAGQLRFDDRLNIAPGEVVGGSGDIRQSLDRPAPFLVRELMAHMIVQSDNTATNKLIDLVGIERVNALMRELGLTHTRLQRRMMDGNAAARDQENISTPNEMARLMEWIAKGKLVDQKASQEMIALLRRVEGGFQQGLPDIESASKTGLLPGVRCESGIVFVPNRPFVLSVMSAFIDDRRNPVPEATRIVYGLFEKLAHSNSYGNRIR